MRLPAAVVSLMLVVTIVVPSAFGAVGDGGVGVTCAPDSVSDGDPGRGCPSWTTTSNDDFSLFDTFDYSPWIDLDVDLLISPDFDGVSIDEVSSTEAHNFLDALDAEFENRGNWDYTDLATAFESAHRSNYPYDASGTQYHFMLYQDCFDEDPPMVSEINHLDVYLVPNGVAHALSPYKDTKEDGSPVGQDIWHYNAVSVTDGDGNVIGGSDEEHWPRQSAQQACHEFTHLIWSSNGSTWSTLYREAASPNPPDYNELFSCAAEYLIRPEPDTLKWDVRYSYSLLNDMIGAAACVDPPASESYHDRNYNRYQLWGLFAAYLGYRFSDPEIENTLLSQWGRHYREVGGESGMERSLCGLAHVLSDADWADDIPGCPIWDGACRTARLFSDYGIARWVNDAGVDSAYYFGDDYSPYWDRGQFMKVDDGAGAFWELAKPPEFVLNGTNVGQWSEYPDTSDVNCPDGWYDYDHGGQYTHTCVPIKTDLWGSNYLVLRANTSVFTHDWTDTLFVELDWTGNMNPNVMLWVSVLEYSDSVDDLFLHGDLLTSVSTESYTTGWGQPSSIVVEVPNFRSGNNEAVVIVTTVTDKEFSINHDPTYKCLRRLDYDYPTSPLVDLEYSFRFKVEGHWNPPSGCPFVWSFGENGYVVDNNVLGNAFYESSDILDSYMLRARPAEYDGVYRLRLSEDERDHSRFDRVTLLAVDHDPGVDASVMPDGTVCTYTVSAVPIACYDSAGRDILDLVTANDGKTVSLSGDDWLEVFYDADDLGRVGGGVGVDGGPTPKNEVPPPGGRGGSVGPGVLDLSPLCYRANPTTGMLQSPDGLVSDGGGVRMIVTSPVDFAVDRLFLTRPADTVARTQECELLRASHSGTGICSDWMVSADGRYVDLRPGEDITLDFLAPASEPGVERDFVLQTKGYFQADDSEDSRDEPAAADIVALSARPNPSNSLAGVAFDITSPGGHIVARIYNMAGRVVRTVLNESGAEAGTRSITWDGKDDMRHRVSSGVYFCRVEADGYTGEAKVVFLK